MEIDINAVRYRQQAEKNRRIAKRVRILSTVFYVLAVGFAIIAVLIAFSGGWTSALTITACVLIIGLNAWSIRESAKVRDDIASRWDRLAAGA